MASVIYDQNTTLYETKDSFSEKKNFLFIT